MVSFKVLYTVGYSLSLLTLISALLILTVFRWESLGCMVLPPNLLRQWRPS